jgi:hypothetical protein
MKVMLAPKVCVEVRFGNSSLMPFAALGARVLVALHLPLWPCLIMPIFLPLLLLSHVLPLFRLLHLAFVLPALRSPISTLRLLRRTATVLRSHLVPIPTLRLLISPVVGPRRFLRPRLLLSILQLPTPRPFVLMFVLRHSHGGHAQQKPSTNPAHYQESAHSHPRFKAVSNATAPKYVNASTRCCLEWLLLPDRI